MSSFKCIEKRGVINCVLLSRLQKEVGALLREEQAGFRAGRGLMFSISDASGASWAFHGATTSQMTK